jgi:hypothetical protein
MFPRCSRPCPCYVHGGYPLCTVQYHIAVIVIFIFIFIFIIIIFIFLVVTSKCTEVLYEEYASST